MEILTILVYKTANWVLHNKKNLTDLSEIKCKFLELSQLKFYSWELFKIPDPFKNMYTSLNEWHLS